MPCFLSKTTNEDTDLQHYLKDGIATVSVIVQGSACPVASHPQNAFYTLSINAKILPLHCFISWVTIVKYLAKRMHSLHRENNPCLHITIGLVASLSTNAVQATNQFNWISVDWSWTVPVGSICSPCTLTSILEEILTADQYLRSLDLSDILDVQTAELTCGLLNNSVEGTEDEDEEMHRIIFKGRTIRTFQPIAKLSQWLYTVFAVLFPGWWALLQELDTFGFLGNMATNLKAPK